MLDSNVFVTLVQQNGQSYVEGQLDYFNVVNMTDKLQTDVINENEKYQKEFAAIKNISFEKLLFRTKLSGEKIMRLELFFFKLLHSMCHANV